MPGRDQLGRWLASVTLGSVLVVCSSALAGAAEARPKGRPALPVEVPVTVPVTVPTTLPATVPALPPLPPVLGQRPAPSRQPTPPAPARPSTATPETRPAASPPAPTAPPAAPPDVAPLSPASQPPVERPRADLAAEAVRTAGRFSLPLGLMTMVTAFLVVQALVDRRDPKLATAPVTDDLYPFR